jgi:hypothetical protein
MTIKQSAIDLVVALNGYNLPKEAENAYFRLSKAISDDKWQGLTREDMDIAFDDTQEGGGFYEFAEAIEAILRRKNGGKNPT